MAKAKTGGERQLVAQNRKARHDFFIDDTLEAGIALAGTEVKALRAGRSNIQDAYAGPKQGELYLLNAYIPEFAGGNRLNHETRRPRKLLVHKRQLNKLLAELQRQGMTLVPLSMYFNEKGLAKVELGLARGKKKYDKRQTERDRDWQRDKARLLRNRG